MDENIKNKINYFIDYWRDFLSDNSIEKSQIHMIVYNPQELFKEFADEINRNQFKKKDNKNFFIDTIKSFSDLPIESINFLKSTLTLIRGQFNDPNYQYLLHLLSEITKLLYDSKLALNCVDELENILTNDKKIDDNILFKKDGKNLFKEDKILYQQKDQIKFLTQLIISQLIYQKYSLTTIKRIIEDIFSSYNISDKYDIGRDYDNPIIYTKFPHNLVPENGDITSETYQKKLKSYLDNLTISQRLLAIKNYFHKEKNKITYILQLEGLKANTNLNLNFGNVLIYNPKETKLIKKPIIESHDEFFGSPDLIYCNGAVTLDVVDWEYGKKEAIIQLNHVVDFLVTNHSDYKRPIRVKKEIIYTIDDNGNEIGSSYSANGDWISHEESITLEESESTKYLSDFYQSKLMSLSNSVDKKIVESLHWKRKAIESLSYNEKILWFWVTIENLIKQDHERTEIIFKILPKLLATQELYYYCWKYFYKLRAIKNFGYFGYYRKILNMPEELILKIGLNKENKSVYLGNLINHLEDVIKCVNESELLYEQLKYLQNIFASEEECIKLLEKFEKLAKEKLLYVYRIRNKIVHNASKEEAILSEYYLDFISFSSRTLIQKFMDKRQNKNLENVSDIVNDIIYDFDKLKIEIKEQGTKILLEH
ncbi:hypothetical protein GM3708_516 [Geminocystis sp. NIES-3708]|uniref:hypothetical protein n=1 Tax=Geminocystis sp. NIES-3708 TaxID=1615909 RepID=UPI0005FC46C3|nr:hypothetical protein [Geminocystis sp. NIES-3708]BAQ60110.1 hypothetical protein GM3708_516 [Geminocystis sp. NIES-3708]